MQITGSPDRFFCSFESLLHVHGFKDFDLKRGDIMSNKIQCGNASDRKCEVVDGNIKYLETEQQHMERVYSTTKSFFGQKLVESQRRIQEQTK